MRSGTCCPTPPIESLSSWGPTTDGRPKPELVAPDRTDEPHATPTCAGTSFAAPVVAGAAALMLSQNSTLSNLQLRAALIAATLDVGAPGHDSTVRLGQARRADRARPDPDADGDGLQDAIDLCPFEPDPLRLDANGDGIGDACQCGDLSGDGMISSADVDVLRDWLTAVVRRARALARCNVIGPAIPLGADCRDRRLGRARARPRRRGAGHRPGCGPALPP